MTRLGPIFCFDMSRVFIQGATLLPYTLASKPPLHTFFINDTAWADFMFRLD